MDRYSESGRERTMKLCPAQHGPHAEHSSPGTLPFYTHTHARRAKRIITSQEADLGRQISVTCLKHSKETYLCVCLLFYQTLTWHHQPVQENRKREESVPCKTDCTLADVPQTKCEKAKGVKLIILFH